MNEGKGMRNKSIARALWLGTSQDETRSGRPGPGVGEQKAREALILLSLTTLHEIVGNLFLHKGKECRGNPGRGLLVNVLEKSTDYSRAAHPLAQHVRGVLAELPEKAIRIPTERMGTRQQRPLFCWGLGACHRKIILYSCTRCHV